MNDPLQKHKCIIFDFEGTIMNGIDLHIKHYNLLAKFLGFTPLDRRRISSFSHLKMSHLANSLHVPIILVPFIVMYLKLMAYYKMNDITIIDGIIQQLTILKKKKYLIGIASSTNKRFIKKFIRLNNLELFDFVETTLSRENKTKLLNMIKHKYHLGYHDILYVGDEVRDILSSKKSSIYSAAVAWGAQSKSSLLKADPDLVIEKPITLAADIEHFFKSKVKILKKAHKQKKTTKAI